MNRASNSTQSIRDPQDESDDGLFRTISTPVYGNLQSIVTTQTTTEGSISSSASTSGSSSTAATDALSPALSTVELPSSTVTSTALVAASPALPELPPVLSAVPAASESQATRVSQHARSPTWVAFSLRWPYLSFLVSLSLLLLGSIEALRQISNRQNGLYYLNDPDPTMLPIGTIVLYAYMPTAVGVVYSILWSYIDLDTKRLEPYYQLRSGCSPSDNLFLDYTFKSTFLTPYQALKRKHWFVAVVSFTFVCISLVLPASQGALFTIDSVSDSVNQQQFRLNNRALVFNSINLGEFIDQAAAISASPGAKLPTWTTTTHSITPFWPDSRMTTGNETWTVPTTVYFAQPVCRRFHVEDIALTSANPVLYLRGDEADNWAEIEMLFLANVSITDEPSCALTVGINLVIIYPFIQPTYILPIFTYGFSEDQHDPISRIRGVNVYPPNGTDSNPSLHRRQIDPALTSGWRDPVQSCPSRRRFAGFLGLGVAKMGYHNDSWHLSTDDVKLTLYDCESTYYRAKGKATVKADSESVVHVGPLDDISPLDEHQFSGSSWEEYLDTGMTQFGNLSAFNRTHPSLNLISSQYSLGDVVRSNLTSSFSDLDIYHSMLEDDTVGETFEFYYRLTFALALRAFLETPGETYSTFGTVHIDTFAVVVVPAFAILSEALLVLSTTTLLVLIFGYNRRRSILRSDPDSISAQCSIIADEFHDLGVMISSPQNLDQLSTKNLKAELAFSQVEFNSPSASLTLTTPRQTPGSANGCVTSIITQNLVDRDALPFFLTKRGVGMAISLLLVIISFLIFLAIWSSRKQGFSHLADLQSFKSQLFWSFAPTLIATLVENAWITLHRDLSILETWVVIRRGNSTAQDSLSLRYSSRPPSLVMFMSAKKKHFVLSLVSFLCVTTSVLNIAMAGLFLFSFADIKWQENTISQYKNAPVSANWSTEYSVTQAFNMLRNEISNSGTIPSWTTHDHALVPLEMPNRCDAASDQEIFTTTTSAIESFLECTEFPIIETLNSSGPGVVTRENGGVAARYPPPDTPPTPSFYCSAYWNETDYALQSVFLKTMFASSVSESLSGNETTNVCSKFNLLLSVDQATRSASAYTCSPRISVSDREIQYHCDGSIVSSTPIDVEATTPTVLANQSDMLAFYHRQFLQEAGESQRITTATNYDWVGLLMTRVRAESGIQSMPELFNRVWRRVFAIWFSTNRDKLLTLRQEGDPSLSSATGTVTRREARMVPSVPAFAVSITLFVLYLGCYIFVVIRRRHRYTGSRLPKTIGSIMPWVVHSRMLDDFAGTNRMNSRERDDVLRRLGHRYGFGRFRGRHGKVVVGIEHEDLLMARGAYGDF